MQNLVEVRVGLGSGHEDRIMENRRLKLKSGKTADVRHAYSLPPDDEIVGVGPVDPQIGILRLDRLDVAHSQSSITSQFIRYKECPAAQTLRTLLALPQKSLRIT